MIYSAITLGIWLSLKDMYWIFFGIYWKKVDNTSAFIGIMAGGAVAFVWFVLKNPMELTPFWAGNAVAIVLIVALSFVRNRGPVADDYQIYMDKVKQIPKDAL